MFDRLRLRHPARAEPAALARFCYDTIEDLCARRGLARSWSENHAEYLDRLATLRPHLQSHCRMLSTQFAAARYGTRLSIEEAKLAIMASRVIADLIDEKSAA